MMQLSNCGRCGRLTTSLHALCPDCLPAERQDVSAVKAYLEAHPHASIMDVVRSTGVSYRTVRSLSAR